MSAQLPIPEFKGFTIKRYSSYLCIPEEELSPYEKKYQTTPITLEYNAADWIYRLFLKVRYNGPWSPYVFAIIYRGETRDEDTPIMALVHPQLGTKEPQKILSREYDENPERYMKDYRNQMQQRDPNEKLPYYFGFLQLDYHHCRDWYQAGLCTIEIKLGTGHVKEKVDRWSDIQKYQWIIPKYTPPNKSE